MDVQIEEPESVSPRRPKSSISSKSKSGLHHIIVTWWKSFFKNTMYVHTYVSERVWFDFLYIMGKIENFVDPGA